MDNELKQRLIGAVVITALAAIFVPMLFDDPVDNSGKAVTELTIPPAPADAAAEIANNLPADKADVLNRPDSDLSVSEEEPHSDVVAEGQAANVSGSEQIEHPNGAQPGMPNNVGSDIQEEEPASDLALKQSGQNEEPSLDTGVVDEADQTKARVEPIVKKAPVAKKQEQDTVKTVGKSSASEKPKQKPIVEKTKTVKAKDDSQKTSSKLTRWSIQAGSFTKKENAQALVDKLRKQGLLASIAAKGNLFRIKIGPALDKKKAIDMKAKLDKQNIQSYLQSE